MSNVVFTDDEQSADWIFYRRSVLTGGCYIHRFVTSASRHVKFRDEFAGNLSLNPYGKASSVIFHI